MSRKFLVPVLLPADPTIALEAVTKQYVDTKPSAGNALGIVAVGSFTWPDASNLTNGAALVYPIVYTMAVGRRYRVRIGMRALSCTGNAYASVQFMKDGVSQTDRYIQIVGNLGYNKFETEYVVDGDGLSHSWVVNWSCPYTVNGYSSGAYYYIEDAGPSASPALPIPETPPAWNALTLQGGWLRNPSGGVPSYRKIGDVVQLQGTLYNTAGSTMRTAAATLPSGFRPAVSADMAFMGANWIPCNMSISTAGVMTPQSNSASDGSLPQNWVPLAGMSFSTTA